MKYNRFRGDCKVMGHRKFDKRQPASSWAALAALTAVIGLSLTPPPAYCVLAGASGPSPEVLAENAAALQEIGRIRIENTPGGVVAVNHNGAWRPLGRVLRQAEKLDLRGFSASRWAPPGTVAATAVNALHIKVAQNEQEDRGITLSVLPLEFAPGSRQPFEEASIPAASIFTDIPSGTAIFGGDDAPFVGDPVFVERGAALVPLPRDYVPARGDVLVVSIRCPKQYPSQLVFENRFGGFIYLEYPNGDRKTIGEVLRPVIGIGRFVGGLWAGIGRIRANHPGVIDISTSLIGEIGGFQIIPANHAMDPETTYVRRLTQWMVVGPLDARDPSWEGVAPLFLHYLRPKYNQADLYADDWQERLLGRFLADVKINGQWQAMPHLSLGTSANVPLPAWADTALENVEAVRIMFPLEPERRRASCPPD
jgi:hypothetical protein